MDVTPRELRDMDIREGFRGYNRDDVDELLERAAATIEQLEDQVRKGTERLTAAESDAGRGRENEQMLQRTLLLAQKTADKAIAEAQGRGSGGAGVRARERGRGHGAKDGDGGAAPPRGGGARTGRASRGAPVRHRQPRAFR